MNLARGLDQMAASADGLPEASALLQCPANRITRIEQAGERGQAVTSAELLALSQRLATRAEPRASAVRQPS